jgi:hypothetical protein
MVDSILVSDRHHLTVNQVIKKKASISVDRTDKVYLQALVNIHITWGGREEGQIPPPQKKTKTCTKNISLLKTELKKAK